MTPKELIKAVYEIAFGEDAYLRGFFPEEVVERLQEFSDGSNPILIEEAWNEAEELNTSLRELSDCLLYTSPSPRDISGSRMPSSA